jgi:UDP-GlcNAc:undecaprenyl-phosphate/decaprenyl-phosphate GlcNAc-1-phosphate transferase
MVIYLLLFLGSLALSILLTPWVRSIAIARGWIIPPASKRHVHTKALPRLGGMAIFIAFSGTLVAFIPISRLTGTNFPVRNLLGILLPACIVFLLGVYDDVKPLQPKSKIAVQSVAATLLYFGGFGIHFSGSVLGGHLITQAIGLPLTVFWVLLITNAFNLIDGLDGLAAGSAFVSALVLFATALLGHSEVAAVLAIALAGAILGFLPSNFYPASIFMGDSGSLFIGFLLSALALVGPQKTTNMAMAGVAIPILLFGLPILDVVLAIARRIVRRQSLFRGDADHIHHKLLKRGLSQSQSVLVLYAVTAAFGTVSFVLVHGERWLMPVLLAVVVGVCIGVRQLRYAEFSRLPAVLRSASLPGEFTPDQANILRATESLRSCLDLRAICAILQETLQPIGFDGIRFKNLSNGRIPASLLYPMQYDLDGRLSFTWSAWKTDDPQPGERHTELVISSHPTLGHVSLFRVSAAEEDLQMELDIVSEDFRTALSSAIGRALNRVKPARQSPQNTPKTRTVAAGSSTESARGR